MTQQTQTGVSLPGLFIVIIILLFIATFIPHIGKISIDKQKELIKGCWNMNMSYEVVQFWTGAAKTIKCVEYKK